MTSGIDNSTRKASASSMSGARRHKRSVTRDGNLRSDFAIETIPGAVSLLPTTKHEPINFLGDSIILLDRVARGPQRRHALLEVAVRQTCQERVGSKGGFLDEARPVRSDYLCDDLMDDGYKVGCGEHPLYVPLRRQLGVDQPLQSRKEMPVRKVRLPRAVADADIAALAQHAMAFSRDSRRVV